MFLCSQAQQFDAQQRPLCQIKGVLGLLGGQALCCDRPLGLREVPEVRYRARQNKVPRDNLGWLSVHRCKGGSQDFVALHKLMQALFQCRNVELTGEAKSSVDVIDRTARPQLVEEPEALLGKGEGQVAIP